MYNVLLVDDEELDLEGMRQFIPWSELGMEVKGTVNNALSACEIMEQQPIDILVSDVNMPYMSGLELARAALLCKPDIRIIFVSGYQEFSYVQQALSLKAYNYVLKPMDDSELVATLLKVKQDLDEALKQREVEEAYQQMIPIAKRDMLVRLFEGELNIDHEARKKLVMSYGLDSLHWPVRVAVMELDKLAWKLAENHRTQQEMSRIFLQQMHEAVLSYGNIPHCKLNTQRIALLVEERELEPCVKRLYESVQEHLSASITTGLGEPVYTIEQLHASFQQAVEAVEGKMFIGKGAVIKYEEVRCDPEMLDARTLDLRMEALLKAMTEYDLVGIYDEFENLFQSIRHLRSKFTVHNLSSYIVWKLEQHLSSMEEDLFELLGIELHNLDILLQFDTINDIRSWLRHHVYAISERLHNKSNTSNSKFIRNVVKTIKDRMSENITLKDFAEHFSFSPSYMGFLIKEKSGYTFNELLVQLRMERACELLKQPGLKIYEIADQVGYRYLPYFSRQFKDKYGMTPLEYRKKAQ
ncbi:response regulator [Paenibacillus albiflavus]|uniref:Response regulator n=1 Tax=Paenibacillus albiflavus TaxID=2545760 RepID=A0A4R4EAV8_9BACL|nr:response regulator [Paenibacillus albiflavus]TCZ75261.1 response regulator [Paenibacillus albiflavus]